MKPISISFCINNRYSQHLAVVIASFLHNNPKYDFIFHVLHHDVTPENQQAIQRMEGVSCGTKATHRSVSICFHKIDGEMFSNFPLPEALEHVTREMYFRFLLPEVLANETRTIYIDVDVLCVSDVLPLWEWDLGEKIVGAVSEGQPGEYKKRLIGLEGDEPYYYSGMLVMDLAAMRQEGAVEKLFRTTMQMAGRIAWPDQDVINTVFRNRIARIPMIWDDVGHYNPFRRDVKIWHFPGALRKPWCPIWKNRGRFPYFRYLLMTPYRHRAWPFIWMHIKGLLFFSYTKKCVTRYLVCGILVWKRKNS